MMTTRARVVASTGAMAALYVVLTWGLAPISYGPLQFRASELLKPLALFHPAFALAFGIGNGIANLWSPFGWYDFILMAFVDMVAAALCWWLRRWVYLALTVQAVVISAGVALFPLGMGAMLPFWLTFAAVLVPELVLIIVGYVTIWRRYGPELLQSQ